MDRGRIAGSAVKLAEAASLTDDPWYGQQLNDLADELAAMTRQVLDAARPTRRIGRERGLLAAMMWARRLLGRFRQPNEAFAAR
jgi:hypothetical protein